MDRRRLLELFGPAWIAMMADVDAASVLTAVVSGETYGYGLLWLMALLTIPLFLIQNVAGRVGVAGRGRGLGELVRERFGSRWALAAAMPMFFVDMFSYAVEFTGMAVGAAMLGLPKLVLVALYGAALLAVAGKRYREAERYILPIALLMPLAFIAEAAIRGYDPSSPLLYVSADRRFLFMVAANVGAVVMPFMLFYQASATSRKYASSDGDERAKASWASRETLAGAVASQILMSAIMVASAGLDGADPMSPAQLASALSRVAGPYSPYVFGVGLIAASFLAYVVIALASVWGAVEALGIRDRSRRDLVYALEPLPALAAVMLMPGNKAAEIALELMAVSPLVLVVPGVLLGLLAMDRDVMGDLACGGAYCKAYWAALALLALSGAVALIY
ncbi:MAG: NRAMP family divalent metal transporter [Thermoproteus sp.]